MKKEKANERIEKLKYQEKCRKLLEKIYEVSPIDLGKAPLTAAKKLDFLFIAIFPDEEKRETKIRLLFLGKFAAGDDIYLRLIYENMRNLANLSHQLTEKYHQEINQFNEQSSYHNRKTKVDIGSTPSKA